ncbi:MAG: thermonuclease family protein [Alphaproteobacteria bacterium]
MAFTSPACAEVVESPDKPRVVDPDTLDFPSLAENLRIKDVDGPEKGWRAKCKKEKELEILGTNYARQLFKDAGTVAIVLSNPPETDRYGRYIGRVQIDGMDYGDLMIAAGYMKAWNYGKEPKPLWCD